MSDADQRPASRSVDPQLLELLVCPLTKTTLSYDAQRQELISRAARLAFPIVDGVPILVAEEARMLDDQPAAGVGPAGPDPNSDQ
jgi:uncharacterized protein YbaR (Trm112 family)